MHRDSALPWSQKTATIKNERKRIEVRSSDHNRNKMHQAAFTNKLLDNGYSKGDIQRIDQAGRRRRGVPRPEGKTFYIDLPFLGEGAERKIRRAFTREGINIRIFRRSTTILDIVRPKSREIRRCPWTTCPTRAADVCFVKNCVYQVTCSPCGRRYVGSTTRSLHDRIKEHTTRGRGSTIYEHLSTCGGGVARVSVKILAREKDEIHVRLREAIIIRRLSPELNCQEESDLIPHIL